MTFRRLTSAKQMFPLKAAVIFLRFLQGLPAGLLLPLCRSCLYTPLGDTMKLLSWVVPALIMMLYVGPAEATPITYTEQATGSGSLGGSPFTNKLTTITVTGDTSGVVQSPANFFHVDGPATVDVSGVGTAVFSDTIEAFDFQ